MHRNGCQRVKWRCANEPFNVTTERRSLTRKWGGFEPVIGLGIDLLFFPTHAIELGLSLRTDELLSGANNGSGSTRQWKGSGVVRRVRTSNLIAVRFGFHL